LICCQKCRANDCRAIAIRAVHPHSIIGQEERKKKIKWGLKHERVTDIY
jgi:hypothetical protein